MGSGGAQSSNTVPLCVPNYHHDHDQQHHQHVSIIAITAMVLVIITIYVNHYLFGI
jgi:hypothetical protein